MNSMSKDVEIVGKKRLLSYYLTYAIIQIIVCLIASYFAWLYYANSSVGMDNVADMVSIQSDDWELAEYEDTRRGSDCDDDECPFISKKWVAQNIDSAAAYKDFLDVIYSLRENNFGEYSSNKSDAQERLLNILRDSGAFDSSKTFIKSKDGELIEIDDISNDSYSFSYKTNDLYLVDIDYHYKDEEKSASMELKVYEFDHTIVLLPWFLDPF